jgi:hypothetical protein
VTSEYAAPFSIAGLLMLSQIKRNASARVANVPSASAENGMHIKPILIRKYLIEIA